MRVPATTANMGPGFDCLGMALDVWNTVRVERHSGPLRIEIAGEGADELPDDDTNLVYRCFSLLFEGAGEPPPNVKITCDNRIPLGRGLGSSSAAAVAGLVAANELRGEGLTPLELLELAARLEGHPDNAAPAIYGGCRIVARDEDGALLSAPVPVPDDLMAVVFVPDVPMPTNEARDLLPPEVPRADAVYNISRAALLVRALATDDLDHLDVATGDRLHQPARQAIFYPMRNIFRAARDAGALGVFLSGAGSSVLALTRGREYTIGYEMADIAHKSGVGGSIMVTRPTQKGAHVEDSA